MSNVVYLHILYKEKYLLWEARPASNTTINKKYLQVRTSEMNNHYTLGRISLSFLSSLICRHFYSMILDPL